jgi:RNA 3'-terminal phosphate cyclase (ATP)
LTATDGTTPATFVGLGERGKPAEAVADEAVDELLAHLSVPDAAIDPHSADQLLLPLALAEGRSVYTTSEATEHLRTNAATLAAFLDRPITIDEPDPSDSPRPARVIVG